MAVSKLWSVTSRLGQVIDYAANPEKTAADIYTEEQVQSLGVAPNTPSKKGA